MNEVKIREMNIGDYDRAISLWKNTKGMGLSEADSRENIAHFLARNPGFSLVAEKGDEIIGTVLCGHDGRRGFLYHLAVQEEHRLQGVGKQLVTGCLDKLKLAGIAKCHIFVFRENQEGQEFWINTGWQVRSDLNVMSKDIV